MIITFGWGCDGARWSDAVTPATRDRVVVGPGGLTDILATRFALSRPALDRPRRTAAYRAALRQVVDTLPDTDWPVESTLKDPWTVATDLLAWRDELIAAGWTGADHDLPGGSHSRRDRAADDDTPARLAVLARIEALLPLQPGWAPGPADTLREIDAVITGLAAADTTWPTGITELAVDNRIADLPPVWQRILSGLERSGVTVTELPEPGPLTELTVLTADTEWDAAPVAARLLADRAAAGDPVTVVAGRSTDLLDRELLRLGTGPVGVRPGTTSPLADTVPVFLRAMTAPCDVHALVELLNLRLPGARGGTRPLLPGRFHSDLVDALGEQPGIGGPRWTDAVADALAACAPDSGDARFITGFDRLIRESPLVDDGEGFATADVRDHLGWLADRLTRLGRGDGDLAGLARSTADLAALVAGLGDRVSARELGQVTAAVTGAGGPHLAAAASRTVDVVTGPAQLGTGSAPVLWWLPVDDGAAARDRLRPTEADWLVSTGVELPDREDVARLTLDSQLRALRRRSRVTAVLPGLIDGAAASGHPALAFLRDDLRRSGGTVTTGAAVLPAGASTVPEPCEPARPDPVRRRFTPDSALVPERLSFSQWETLLIHPLEWLLRWRLGVRAGGLADVPTGNRMVGTWLHAAVEEIVTGQLADNDGDPVTVHVTATGVAEVLERLLPWYASELLLPGRQRERGTTLALAVRSVTGLFTTLADAAIRVRAVEADFDTALTGSRGADGAPLRLRGFRDMDIVLADGTPGVIDLKYTFAKKKYRDKVARGTALQLAVYAKSVAAEQGSATLAEIPVAYFSLHDDQLHTASPAFGLDAGDTVTVDPNEQDSERGSATPDELWDRAVTGLNRVLDDLRAGRVTDLGNLLADPAWQAYEHPKKNEDPVSPVDAETTREFRAALDLARTTGFLPEDAAPYTDVPVITGLQGDYA
jgi:ATP-dependent helicase/nuclease subunit B